jgi:hypothetical protein
VKLQLFKLLDILVVTVFVRDKKYSLKDSAMFTGLVYAVTGVLILVVMLEVGRMSM